MFLIVWYCLLLPVAEKNNRCVNQYHGIGVDVHLPCRNSKLWCQKPSRTYRWNQCRWSCRLAADGHVYYWWSMKVSAQHLLVMGLDRWGCLINDCFIIEIWWLMIKNYSLTVADCYGWLYAGWCWLGIGMVWWWMITAMDSDGDGDMFLMVDGS